MKVDLTLGEQYTLSLLITEKISDLLEITWTKEVSEIKLYLIKLRGGKR